MFDITCPTCQRRSLRTTTDIEEFLNTPDGPVAIVACPQGHRVVFDFHTGKSRIAPHLRTNRLELAS